MNQEIEKFVRENREAFERVEIPDVEAIWQDISQSRPKPGLSDFKGPFLFIATMLVLSVFISLYANGKERVDWTVPYLEELDPELANYQTLMMESIQEQEDLLETMSIDEDDYQDIQHSLEQLDVITKKYKEDLQKNAANPQIIKALLRCAKQRVRLYELLLYKHELKKYQDELNLQS